MINMGVYPTMEEFYHDLGQAYKQAITGFYDAGCRYIQIDDCSFAYLCDPKQREMLAARGDDPTKQGDIYVGMINAALAGKPIDVFNYGRHKRDFTYVADIVQGVVHAMDHIAEPNPAWNGDEPDPGTSKAPYRIYNIGNQKPVELSRYIEVLEECLGKKAQKNLLPLQLGDLGLQLGDGLGRPSADTGRHFGNAPNIIS